MKPEYRSRPGVAHQLAIVARMAARAVGRRLRGRGPVDGTHDEFRRSLQPWLDALPEAAVAASVFVDLPASQPPWLDTGLDVAAGENFTLLARGRVYLSRLLDVWVPAWFQVWFRVGEAGTIFRGTRNLQSFAVGEGGRLWLANYFPGEWSDRQGGLATPTSVYASSSGGTSLLLLRWAPGTDVEATLREAARRARVPAFLAEGIARLAEPVVTPPHRWEYLWFLGPAEIYRPSLTPEGRPAVSCLTQGDSGILHRDVRLRLAPGARLRWSWRVDELPTDLPEDTLPSHEYLSIAVEFDDGQDITYFWSNSLPVGKAFGCPLPNWKDRELHVVVRSGRSGLGCWLAEERDVHDDYQRYVGGPASSIVRVWFIANSLLSRGRGRCEYGGIELESGGEKIEVL